MVLALALCTIMRHPLFDRVMTGHFSGIAGRGTAWARRGEHTGSAQPSGSAGRGGAYKPLPKRRSRRLPPLPGRPAARASTTGGTHPFAPTSQGALSAEELDFYLATCAVV